ncbi:MAG: alpha-L-fucosidase, partial [Clostridia bacterium]|nr:alpha-L-fucosidase [Clostridia bacterium]
EEIQEIRYFEECRGIGRSFGVNRIETTEDYMSAAELIELLVDLVAAGGNFLLNVGPNADGTIPVIMQERLEQMGEWLKVNGEGIYASRKLKKSKLDKVWYTQKDGKIYVFFAGFPFAEKTIDLDFDAAYRARLLGCDAKVDIAATEEGMKFIFPAINPDDMKSDYIYTVCLEK